MPTQIKPVTTYQFSSVVGDQTYNFNVVSTSHAEACQKLMRELTAIVEEVKGLVKPGAN